MCAPRETAQEVLSDWPELDQFPIVLGGSIIGVLAPPGSARPAALSDQVHRIMHLWKAGDVHQVDGYIEGQGLRRNPMFPRLLQALVELAGKDNQQDERALLESIMNYVGARGAHPQMRMGI